MDCLRFELKLTSIILSVLIFHSCKNASRDLEVYKTLDQGIIKSNRVLNTQTSFVYHNLESKLYEPAMSVKAQIWHTKADKLRQYSSDISEYIDSLRMRLLKTSGYEKDNDEIYRRANKTVVNELFIKEKEADTLYDHLEKFKQTVLAIDPLIKAEFGNSIQALSPNSDSTLSNKEFGETYFNDASLPATLAILSQLQNNVRVTENRICNFCNQQVGITGDYIKMRYPLISKSSNHIKTGEVLEIIAGIGSYEGGFTSISINKKNVPIGDSGFARYNIKVPAKAGKYSLPVSMTYLDVNNKMVTKTQVIRYIVDE